MSHARVLQGVVLGFALTSVGLIAGSFALRSSNDNEWTQGSRFMLAGGVVALFAEGIGALARQNEMLAAINAYNHDLVTGRLQMVSTCQMSMASSSKEGACMLSRTLTTQLPYST